MKLPGALLKVLVFSLLALPLGYGASETSDVLSLLQGGSDRPESALAVRKIKTGLGKNAALVRWMDQVVEFQGAKEQGPAFRAAEILGDAGVDIPSTFPSAYGVLLRKSREGDHYHRLGAAGTLYRLRLFDEKTYTEMLFREAAAREGSAYFAHPDLLDSIQELKRRNPATFTENVLAALRGNDAALQRGALHAINVTEVRRANELKPLKSPELLKTLSGFRFDGAGAADDIRSHGAWLYDELRFGKVQKSAPVGSAKASARKSARRVAVVTGEVVDIFNTGGLGGAVLKYSQASNATPGASKVTVIMPYYQYSDLSPEELKKVVDIKKTVTVPVDFGADGKAKRVAKFSVFSYQKGNTEIWMLRHHPGSGEVNFFDNPRIPGQTKFYGPRASIGKGFAAFGKAAAQLTMDEGFDVVSAADWHAGWTQVALEEAKRQGHAIPKRMTWVHNANYKGEEFNTREVYSYLGLDEARYHKLQGADYWGQPSPLKGAAYHSDLVSTVSSQYSAEMATPRFGYGLEYTFQDLQKQGRLTGVLNGIDNEEWTPKDFSVNDLAGKKAGKLKLQEHFGLPQNSRTPVIVSTARITKQKGFDYSIDALREFLSQQDAQFIIVGDTDPAYLDQLKKLVEEPRLKNKIRWVKFSAADERKALMYSDGFFLPSEFEPSGLNQQYALRTGSVPVVTSVGGLKETVHEGKNGFVAEVILEPDGKTISIPETKKSVIAALNRFTKAYHREPDRFAAIRRQGMTEDNSWAKRIPEYEAAYQYMEQGGSEAFTGHPIADELSGLRPSQLLQLSKKINRQKCALGRYLNKFLVNETKH
ncbi:MAG TPA: hypothetical protein DCS07_01935 [Bdellovibrionales bacterium]|nr:MAG: hypothetical protein A2X97_09280 [Bdellovibrionales bacterium GWA1_52_35]OFZ39845.1 MAG: hypothetical protein A2070_04540 [Bdellovibrionales bacterium GWC1_52_8]HAR41385.1 hypothetical protein [Bdellovibrionales bacterium]HCM38885.1 hypothetical protein [Bdellovibrionales bacterium]